MAVEEQLRERQPNSKGKKKEYGGGGVITKTLAFWWPKNPCFCQLEKSEGFGKPSFLLLFQAQTLVFFLAKKKRGFCFPMKLCFLCFPCFSARFPCFVSKTFLATKNKDWRVRVGKTETEICRDTFRNASCTCCRHLLSLDPVAQGMNFWLPCRVYLCTFPKYDLGDQLGKPFALHNIWVGFVFGWSAALKPQEVWNPAPNPHTTS